MMQHKCSIRVLRRSVYFLLNTELEFVKLNFVNSLYREVNAMNAVLADIENVILNNTATELT